MEAGLNLMSCKSIRGRGKYIRIVLSCHLLSVFFHGRVFCCVIGRSNSSAIDAYSASLFVALKDYKCAESIQFLVTSHKKDEVVVTYGPDFSCKPVQLVLTERLEDEVDVKC